MLVENSMVNLEQSLWYSCSFVVISVEEKTWDTGITGDWRDTGNHRIESEKREHRAKWPAGSVSEVLGRSATGAVRMRTIKRELEDLDNPQES